MFKTLLSLKTILVLITVLTFSSVAFSQANRTWVSGLGDDMNDCSRTNPCKTFIGALTHTNAGGEINVRDPGGFGTITISKSITIDGGGTFASSLAAGTSGININITSSADVQKSVRLRNLSINGMMTGTNAISVNAARQVFIEDVSIDGFQNGINVTASGAYLSVKNSIIRNIAHFGIRLDPGGTTPGGIAAIEGCSISTTQIAVGANHGVHATIRDSAILRNEIGIEAEDSDVLLLNSLVAHGGRGIMARAHSVIRLSLSTITRNDTGLAPNNGGRIISFKNNVVEGNATDGTPTSTSTPT
ncbi:MAG TPA: right-handed parallel beta-helix repeat-containing protein [Pyrinomonadaceae bacterium]|nr:right-handed parallel beta-helix repeat-containing protein [Pyrinomonadaceae bacterium]